MKKEITEDQLMEAMSDILVSFVIYLKEEKKIKLTKEDVMEFRSWLPKKLKQKNEKHF